MWRWWRKRKALFCCFLSRLWFVDPLNIFWHFCSSVHRLWPFSLGFSWYSDTHKQAVFCCHCAWLHSPHCTRTWAHQSYWQHLLPSYLCEVRKYHPYSLSGRERHRTGHGMPPAWCRTRGESPSSLQDGPSLRFPFLLPSTKHQLKRVRLNLCLALLPTPSSRHWWMMEESTEEQSALSALALSCPWDSETGRLPEQDTGGMLPIVSNSCQRNCQFVLSVPETHL